MAKATTERRFPWNTATRKASPLKRMRAALLATIVLALSMTPIGCGDDDHHHDHDDHEPEVTGPGFLTIDDSSNETAPLLAVTYTTLSSPEPVTANILSDAQSDGDIAFDPISGSFTVTAGSNEVFVGEDSFNDHRPQYRAFLTFPLDGITGQAVIPGDATIISTNLEVRINRTDFQPTIPTFVDLIQYQFRGLSTADYNAPLVAPDAFVAMDLLSSDQGNFVDIDVTPLMQQAQINGLQDFQVRFALQSLISSAAYRPTSPNAARTANSAPRRASKVQVKREASSAKVPTPEALASRHR